MQCRKREQQAMICVYLFILMLMWALPPFLWIVYVLGNFCNSALKVLFFFVVNIGDRDMISRTFCVTQRWRI